MKVPANQRCGFFTLLISVFIFTISCSKDHSLLEEYALSDKDDLLNGFIIDDSFNVPPSGTITIDVLANDNIGGQGNVVITNVSDPSFGTVQINDDNTITYTLGTVPAETDPEPAIIPDPEETDPTDIIDSEETENVTEESNTDSFDYVVETTDGEGETTTEEGTVTVIVDESCSADSIIPEYRLNGVWLSGDNNLTVVSGTEVLLSMLPNSVDFNIELPDGKIIDSDYNIGTVTVENSGSYIITSSEGCSTTIHLTVTVDEEIPSIPEVDDLGELKAFPGAEGFGRYTTGGRGGRIIEVTNLDNSGTGSLRAAIEASGPRTIIFKVAGYITVQKSLTILNGDLTIAGQTAPGDGITIRRDSDMDQPALEIKSDNIIIRGLRIRAGKGRNREHSGDAAGVGGSYVIFDHCSLSWSTDEIINPYESSYLTFQNCIFSEGLMYSSHEYSTDSNNPAYYNPHSMGALITGHSTDITIYNSVFAHNNQRNPAVQTVTGNSLKMELVNNIYYNWGIYGTTFEGNAYNELNFINNLHIPGPDTKADRYPLLISDNTYAYARGNLSQYRSSSDPQWDAIGYMQQGNLNMTEANSRASAFDFPLKNEPTLSRDNLLSSMTSNAGAFVRDAVDTRIFREIQNGNGSLINDPSDVGGYPPLSSGISYTDSDKDGMSDNWETANGLDPNNYEDGILDRNSDGYTNVEEFLHFLTQE